MDTTDAGHCKTYHPIPTLLGRYNHNCQNRADLTQTFSILFTGYLGGFSNYGSNEQSEKAGGRLLTIEEVGELLNGDYFLVPPCPRLFCPFRPIHTKLATQVAFCMLTTTHSSGKPQRPRRIPPHDRRVPSRIDKLDRRTGTLSSILSTAFSLSLPPSPLRPHFQIHPSPLLTSSKEDPSQSSISTTPIPLHSTHPTKANPEPNPTHPIPPSLNQFPPR